MIDTQEPVHLLREREPPLARGSFHQHHDAKPDRIPTLDRLMLATLCLGYDDRLSVARLGAWLGGLPGHWERAKAEMQVSKLVPGSKSDSHTA